jgi:hypothetical protein
LAVTGITDYPYFDGVLLLSMKKTIWTIWIILTLALLGFYLYKILFAVEKGELLIGETTYGHYQIEMACAACHTDDFGGKEVLQDACMNCHEAELKEARDSHPKKKFTDPRNADLLEILDARYCMSCHTEHQKEQTRAMGVTLPDDYCFHCHSEVGDERASHQDLEFNSCASAGCHNFHDNRALYEDFLVEKSGGEWVKPIPHPYQGLATDAGMASLKDLAVLAEANHAAKRAQPTKDYQSLSFEDKAEVHIDITESWQHSSHANADVNCAACHTAEGQSWIPKPGVEQCQTCHAAETETFLQGKHGMRLAQDMPALDPQLSDLDFLSTAKAHNGCVSCHKPHDTDVQFSRTEACLNCHSDQHSLAFEDSPHGQLQLKADAGEIDQNAVVSCATCHLPRIEKGKDEIFVNHNQNDVLRPNEKMIRPVCLQCHSLDFSIDALADKALIENNFSGKPSVHIPSIDWALKRVEKK